MSKPKKQDKGNFLLSKSLSWLLRHGAPKEKFTIHKGGFLDIDDVLSHKRIKKYTLEDIKKVVETNNKQRFTIREDPNNPDKLQIRANQGHSFDVEDLELTPILEAIECPRAIHGTYYNCWDSIQKKGLSKMNRNHIHFAPGELGNNEVISGMRSDVELYIFADLNKALKDGIQFFRSQNNVILTPGNSNGCLEPMYFKKVVDVKTKEFLDYAM